MNSMNGGADDARNSLKTQSNPVNDATTTTVTSVSSSSTTLPIPTTTRESEMLEVTNEDSQRNGSNVLIQQDVHDAVLDQQDVTNVEEFDYDTVDTLGSINDTSNADIRTSVNNDNTINASLGQNGRNMKVDDNDADNDDHNNDDNHADDNGEDDSSAHGDDDHDLSQIPFQYFDMDNASVMLDKLRNNAPDLVNLDFFGDGTDDTSNQMTMEMARCLSYNTRLRGILYWGSGNLTGDLQIVKSLETNEALKTRLEKLDLSEVSDESVMELSHGFLSNKRTSLKYLKLGGKKMTDVGGVAVATSLQRNETVTHLVLSHSNVSDQTAIALAGGLLCYKETALQHLDLGSAKISDLGGAELAEALKGNNTLTYLSLEYNPISDKGVLALGRALKDNNQLRTLVLRQYMPNKISNDGVVELAQGLMRNSSVEKIDLSFCNISDRGAVELARALEQNHTLTDLDLSFNFISDQGAKAFAQALFNNTTLKVLHLNNNDIHDAGAMELAQALSRNTTVKIPLMGNPISPALAKDAVQALYDQYDEDELDDDPFPHLYGLGVEQDREVAFQTYVYSDYQDTAPIAWMYQTGCGTEASIEMAKSRLEASISTEKNPMPSSLFLLADILASSVEPMDLHRAKDVISQIDEQSIVYQRGQWLLPFITKQMDLLEGMDGLPVGNLRPDSIHDADLQVVAYIGRGQFGKVYLGQLRRKQWVAVKFLSVDLIETEKEQTTLLLCERFTWRILDACKLPNMAKYIGFVDDLGNMQRGLVFELCADISKVEKEALEAVKKFTSVHFVENLDAIPDWSDRIESSLRSSVVLAPKRRFALSDIIGMLRQVAEGLAGVHKNGILHRDIADRNVLCDKLGNVQLTDMGLAKFVGRGISCNDDDPIDKYQCYLTPGHHYALAWHAPECIGERYKKDVKMFKAVFSTNSDVYSLGMLMWQCFAHRDPFDEKHFRPDDPENASSIEQTARRLMSAILDGERPDLGVLDKDTPDRLVNLISKCWETDPEDRPTTDEIIKELGEIELESINSKPVSQKKRRAKDCKRKWFDVAPLYFSIPETNEKSQHKLAPGGFAYQVRQQQLIPPSSRLAKHIGELIDRANTSRGGDRDLEDQCKLLREMQALEEGMMTWLSNLAAKEVQEQYKPNDEDIQWTKHISRFYHALVPLLRDVLSQRDIEGGIVLPSASVFISHTGHDKQSYASPVANYLTKNGVENVFIDKRLPIGSKGDDEIMWAAVTCQHFWCVLSKEFITRWYPLRELMIGYVRHIQEQSTDFSLLLDCLEQGRNPNGSWMEQIFDIKALQIYHIDGTNDGFPVKHNFPAGMQKCLDEDFDKRIERIATLLLEKKPNKQRKMSSITRETS